MAGFFPSRRFLGLPAWLWVVLPIPLLVLGNMLSSFWLPAKLVHAYVSHYQRERNHQGLKNWLIEAGEEVGQSVGDVQCREHLGDLLHYYYRQAA